MKVINPLTNTDVLQRSGTLRISKKKKAAAAIMAMVPTKNVKAVYELRSFALKSSNNAWCPPPFVSKCNIL